MVLSDEDLELYGVTEKDRRLLQKNKSARIQLGSDHKSYTIVWDAEEPSWLGSLISDCKKYTPCRWAYTVAIWVLVIVILSIVIPWLFCDVAGLDPVCKILGFVWDALKFIFGPIIDLIF
jgi:hypothetical protein